MSSATCYRYRIPLTAPLSVPNGSLSHREGLLIAVEHPSGGTCWGEAAPLPGFCDTSLDTVQQQAQAWIDGGGANRLTDDDSLYADDTPGSLQFAIDHIALQWAAHEVGTSLLNYCGIDRVMQSGNALWRDSEDRDMRQALLELKAEGVSTVKVKVGHRAVEDDLDHLDALFASLPTGMQVRLDANQAWTRDEAATVCEALQHRRALSYLEEPLQPTADLRAFLDETSVPIALDETLRQHGMDTVVDWPVAAFVVKPAWTGIRRVQAWADRVAPTPVVVTSAYETGVGWRGTLAVAVQVTPADVAIGMSTYSALAEDFTRPALPNVQGKLLLTAPGMLSNWTVDRTQLQAV